VQLLSRHESAGADVTLGIFPTDRPEKLCPVEMDATGRILAMTDKPAQPKAMNTWGCACWSPSFTQFMHDYLAWIAPPGSEVVLASVLRAAMADGLAVYGHFFPHGEYIDIGTPDDLVMAVRRFSHLLSAPPGAQT
jgi:glucose-1-phosphate thymidylyltransferase